MVILKVCKNDLNYTDAICENMTHGGLDENSEYQNNVQKETARFNVYKSVVENLVPFFFVLFLGPWSDKHGRKVPLVLSVLGTLLSQVGALVNSIFMHWPKEYLFLMGSLPYSFGGGSMCLFMMLFTYISDTSSIETRTIRVAILDAFLFAGWPAGNLLGAYLYNLDYSKRFINVYSVVVSISAANILYSLVRVRGNTHLTSKGVRESGNIQSELHSSEGSSSHSCCDVFDVRNVRDVVVSCSKQRPHHRRLVIWLLLFMQFLGITSIQGEMTANYLFVQKQYGWTEWDYSLYLLIGFLFTTVGTVCGVPLLTKFFHASDPMMAGIATFFQILSRLASAFAPTGWFYTAAAVLTLFSHVMSFVARSMLSKCVPQQELGKVFAMLAVVEAIVPMFGGSLYGTIYAETVDWFPGTFYLISAFLLLISQALGL
ncbi:unnamed protein product [Darwinula stevensoni]|uniref:Proton-coupled folate transporter n=1 Tax=Darwinula stevensoni TaxID=69355 RepID=A0A7R8XD37_9CRUS|nr:unnamed protein product [Darwinula stevensoni]CAG0886398.1 unnamed protein product [Darwinula stevensoni]